jgi:hypothetical protein
VNGPPVLVSTERRQSVRFSTTVPALVCVRVGVPLIPCTILDVSLEGCRIRLETSAAIPDYFTLFLTNTGKVRRACKVIWRQDDLLGVSFFGRFDHH